MKAKRLYLEKRKKRKGKGFSPYKSQPLSSLSQVELWDLGWLSKKRGVFPK